VSVNATSGQKSWIVALLLCFFLGGLGIHRFYVGKVGTGILQIVTVGGFFGIWVLVDFIMILLGKFNDKQGQALAR
jgi:TM2 domain-containing membrane protein YozV